jgi:hypothetical protein
MEVVERSTRFINALFIEVKIFSYRQSCILHTVHAEGCVILHIMGTVCTSFGEFVHIDF